MSLCLIVLGRQGSGKGTQCGLLEEKFNLVHVSTGEMLREAVKTDSPIGRKVKKILDSGELVGDEMMKELVAERLSKADVQLGGVVLDGFPRNASQADALVEILENLDGAKINTAINLDVPAEVAIDRMLQRGRTDDTQEAIQRRLEIYEEQTAPLLAWFEDRKLLRHIEGSGTPEEVFKLFCETIGDLVGVDVGKGMQNG